MDIDGLMMRLRESGSCVCEVLFSSSVLERANEMAIFEESSPRRDFRQCHFLEIFHETMPSSES